MEGAPEKAAVEAPGLPSKLVRRMVGGVLFGMAVYVGILVWADVGAVAGTLKRIPWWLIPACTGLSFLNYAVRFWKWQRYLALLGVRLDRGTSFLIYLSGLSMSVTPGKMGEVFKSWLLKKRTATPIHASAPIVVAERFTDLLGYLILVAIGGIHTLPGLAWIFWGTIAVCVAALFLAGSEASARVAAAILARTPYLWRLGPRVEGSFASARILLAPREVLLPTLVSVAGWGLECAGFWLIANALVPGAVPFLFATFTYAFSAVAGAVLVVFPAGLFVTELSLGKLLRPRYTGAGLALEAAQQSAAGAVILARLCTLWFGVAVGFAALALFTRRHGRLTAEELAAERS
jgi:uncharacterized protein (TIRG00374 family)